MVANMEEQVRQLLGHYIFGTDKATLQGVIGDLLQALHFFLQLTDVFALLAIQTGRLLQQVQEIGYGFQRVLQLVGG